MNAFNSNYFTEDREYTLNILGLTSETSLIV